MTDKMRITTSDSEGLSRFIKDNIIVPMEKRLTGSITIHVLEGEIRAVEILQHTRCLSKTIYFKEDKENDNTS